ncbi:MAG: ribonuclease PH [Actinobacteria bacterium 69-20]|nr:ribonuclease PH [Actinomycetota bacterium]OJV24711.1 MAG: ribonuclease PH [Actinobacteria bacterium 69-20]
MKRAAVIRRLRAEARRQGLEFAVTELANHTGITVGSVRSTLKRHREIDDVTARRFFEQFAGVLGKGWWR